MSSGLDIGVFIIIAGIILVVWACGAVGRIADSQREPFFDVELDPDGWSWEDVNRAFTEIRDLPVVRS